MSTYRNEEYYEMQNARRRQNARAHARARELKLRRQKRIAVASVILIVCLCILLGQGIRTFARSGNSESLHTYYTTVTVKDGDTIWSLADDYLENAEMDKNDYVTEVCRLNNIPNGEIRPGQTIVMEYFSYELK